MAKALMGHMGGRDSILTSEIHRLRLRVRDLEMAMLRLQAENDRLVAATHSEELLTLADEREPALT